MTYQAKHCKVLVLEDELNLASVLKDYLEACNYEVVCVHNGADGVRAIMEDQFDVIFCDIIMPTMSGDLFYSAVERMKPWLCERFIFVTGARDNKRIKEFLARINAAVLPKPFLMEDLVEMIGFVQLKRALL